MTAFDSNVTIGAMVADQPHRSRVFEELGIDYCCGGRKPLEQACRERGLDVVDVLGRIKESDRAPDAQDTDWAHAPMSELADHIERTHHAYLRRELPRLTQLTRKVAAVHGRNRAELVEVAGVIQGLRAELESHMLKEEQILFPIIRRLEHAGTAGVFHCGSVNNPISVMEHEHDSAGRALARLNELTGGYVPPMDACGSWRAMLDGLQTLERDLHVHIHKENNILFPRASRREAELSESLAAR